MVRMPEEIDHHKSVYISKKADDYIMQSGVGNVVFDFEDTKFMAIKEYDLYLKKHYGDYMQLPPIENRISHEFKAYYL